MKKSSALFSLCMAVAVTVVLGLTSCHKSKYDNPAPSTPAVALPATGSQWVHINSLPSDSITALEVNDNIIYAASAPTGKIYESADNGATWSATNPMGTGIHISAIAIANGKIFAGNFNGTMYSSTDNGKTWANEGDPTGAVTSFTKWNNELYCSSYDNLGKGVLKLNTANNKWEPALTSSLGNVRVSKLVVLNNYLAAATSDFFAVYDPAQQAWHTKDYVDITKARYKNVRFANYVIDMLYDQGTFLAQAYVGNNDEQSLLRSDDQGATMYLDTVGIKADPDYDHDNYLMRGLLATSNKTYAVTDQLQGTIGVWIQHRDKGAPAGTTWAKDQEFLPGIFAYAIRSSADVLFLATNNGLYYKKEQ